MRAYGLLVPSGVPILPQIICPVQAALSAAGASLSTSCAAGSVAAQLQVRSRQATGSALKRSMSAGEDGWMVMVMLLFALYRDFPVSSVMVMPARAHEHRLQEREGLTVQLGLGHRLW